MQQSQHYNEQQPQQQKLQTQVSSPLTRALDEKVAAQYIGMSVSFLQKDRMDGNVANRAIGPDFIKVGRRVMYLREQLDAWLEQHIVDRVLH